MRINTGSGWQEMGPASATGGLAGGRFDVGLSDTKSPTAMPASSGATRCVVCNDACLPGRYACSAEHQKLAYGNRGFARG